MKRVQGVGVLVLMALSAAAGWMLLVPRPVAHTPVVVTAAPSGGMAQALSVMAWPGPAADALDDAAAPARPAVPAPAAIAGAAPVAPGPVDAADLAGLVRQLREGDAAQREAALLQARGEGVLLPEGLLHQLMATETSAPVRMAAFDAWVEQHAGSVEALRAALQSALAVRDTALQARAREQLDALERMQQEAALQPPAQP